MSRWILATIAICSYGFFKELRVLTPFIYEFLLEDKNFTLPQLEGYIFPFSTYSHLVVLIPVFFLTDLLRYKPVIISEAILYTVTWTLLIWGTSLLQMQFMQITYGCAVAAEVAYYSYIYAIVDESHYQVVTSYVRGAVLSGRAIGYITGQSIMWLVPGAPYDVLNYVSIVSLLIAAAISLILPHTKIKDATNNTNNNTNKEETVALDEAIHLKTTGSPQGYFPTLWGNFKRSYSNKFILKWSIWWAVASCGFFQVGNYIQARWADLYRETDSAALYNGITESVSTLIGAIVAMLIQFLRVDWSVAGEITLAIISLIDAVLLIVISFTHMLILSHIFYVIFCVLYQALITIATYNIASKIEQSCHGLIFGCNTFLALLIQTILTFVVVDHSVLQLDIKHQFLVYGGYHAVVSLLFLVMGVMTIASMGSITECWRITFAKPADTQNSSVKPDEEPHEIPLIDVAAGLRGAEVFTTSNG